MQRKAVTSQINLICIKYQSSSFIVSLQSLWRTFLILFFPNRFSVESNGRRVRGRDAVEPDWLVNYKKKQKERRDSQERNQPFVFQQSIESSSYSRPIVPKLSGGAYTVSLPSGPSPSDRGQVAWVTITSSESTWKALTPTQVVKDACERDNTLIAGNMPSVRSAPTVRYVWTHPHIACCL